MPKQLTAKEALQNWANDKNITPPTFARDMGYSYNHAYQLLRGESDVTLETLGRFVVAYGLQAAQPIAEAFGMHTDMDGALVLPQAAKSLKRVTA